MTSIDLSLRLASAFRYHKFLAKHSDSSWFEALDDVESNIEFGIPEVMVLLHPRWHDELKFTTKSDPRGLTNFSAAAIRAKCRSHELWGYECPYEGSKIHIDHTFPFSRGGATKDDNAMYLCKEHNLSKSTDLHLVPWETFTQKLWIKTELEVFLVMAQRLVVPKVFLPFIAMKKI